jgi:uncharacterized protein
LDPRTQALADLYSETDGVLSGWSCAASGDCCQFSITRRQPDLWPIEWRVLQKALRDRPPAKSSLASGDCPAFDAPTRRCRVYQVRPFGCRTNFCSNASASGKNPRREIRDLARRLAELAARDDARAELRPLLTWHAMQGRGGRGY